MSWLKKILWALLALVLIVAIAVAIYVFKSLPQLEGQARLSSLKAPVTAMRDNSDVVHIKAASTDDAFRALGYVHAQERLWQLEFNRRLMEGQLSEILGTPTLGIDKTLRMLDVIGAAKRQWERLEPESRQALIAYSQGINDFIASSSQALSPEFHLLRTSPGRWEPYHSVAWAIMMALDLANNWDAEWARFSALRQLPTERMWQLLHPYPGEEPASKLDLARLYRDAEVYRPHNAAATSALDPAPWDLSRSLAAWGMNDSKGSNNWVLAGSRSTSGKPLLANDPHLGLSAPAIWFFVHLEAPGLNVIGASLPGLPFVVLGRTRQVAWGFTNTGPDTQDLYLEKLDPSSPERYLSPQGSQSFERRQHTIKVKGQADVSFSHRVSRHGPVVSDGIPSYGEVIDTSRYAVALRFLALDADNTTVDAGLASNRANSVEELLKAYAKHHSPMQNVVMADTSGRIFYKAVGRAVVRSKQDDIQGLAPAPGWLAAYDWIGTLSYDQTPEQDGAATGFIATANQRITAANYPHYLGQDWALPYRHRRISDLIQSQERHDLTSLAAIQNDVLSLATLQLLPYLKQAQSQHPLAAQAQAQLAPFDGRMSANSAAALMFAVWVDELTRGLIAPRLGANNFAKLYGKRQFRPAVEHILATNDAFWCAPKSCAEQVNAAWDRALVRLEADYGKAPDQWQWGRAHPALSSHKPFGAVPALAWLFNLRQPSGGDSFSINVGQNWLNEDEPFANRHAASMRALYDLADLDKSQFIYQSGQSGVVFSPRYRDMKQAWAEGGYRSLSMKPAAISHQLDLVGTE